MLKSLCGVLLAFVLALALAQEAGAKPRSEVLPGGAEFSFSVRGSHGYHLEIESSRPDVGITVSRGGLRNGIVSYSVRPRRFDKRGFEAKLPGIGRIAVQFRPRGRARELPPFEGCRGKPGKLEFGHFVGTINFHGERGYTEVTATRARGRLELSRRQTCPPFGGGGGKPGKDSGGLRIEASLTAFAKRGGTLFTASNVDFGKMFGADIPPFITYSAAQLTGSRGVSIMRAASSGGPVSSFTAEHTGRTASARLEPPDPFSGTADFAIQPDGTVNWTGDLSVTFPGTGPIRLTGKRFLTELCVKDKCAGNQPQSSSRFAAAGRLAALSSAAPTPRPWPK